MRYFLALTFLSLAVIKAAADEGAEQFAAWVAAVDSAYHNRTVRYATTRHEFRNIVVSLPQTEKLLESDGVSKANILESLKSRYKAVLTKEVESSESDQFLGLLYCLLQGLDPNTVAGSSEAGTYNLDRVLGKQLFDVSVANPWKEFFERDRSRRLESDPFADPFAVQESYRCPVTTREAEQLAAEQPATRLESK